MPTDSRPLLRLPAETSGLGLPLDEVEAAAEAMLADQAGLDFDDPIAPRGELPEEPPAFPQGALPREAAGLAGVAGARPPGAAPRHPWGPDPGRGGGGGEAPPQWVQRPRPPPPRPGGG